MRGFLCTDNTICGPNTQSPTIWSAQNIIKDNETVNAHWPGPGCGDIVLQGKAWTHWEFTHCNLDDQKAILLKCIKSNRLKPMPTSFRITLPWEKDSEHSFYPCPSLSCTPQLVECIVPEGKGPPHLWYCIDHHQGGYNRTFIPCTSFTWCEVLKPPARGLVFTRTPWSYMYHSPLHSHLRCSMFSRCTAYSISSIIPFHDFLDGL